MLPITVLAALCTCSLSFAVPQEPDMDAESPFDTQGFNSLGIAAAEAQEPKEIKNPAAAAAAARACEWLAKQQNKDGSWSPVAAEGPRRGPKVTEPSDDDFWDRALDGGSADEVPAKASRLGDPLHSIGVTGLSLMALVGDGSSMTRGPRSDAVTKAVRFLIAQQDRETGLIGDPIGHAFHYDHAIATLALARVYGVDRSAVLALKIQAAANYIARARNPYRVWRYDNPPSGDNDSSITTWMCLALAESKALGLKVDEQSFPAVVEWFNEMTEKGTGRVGYTETGSRSSRIPGMNDNFTAKPETLTAAGLVSRLACGQTPRKNPSIVSHVRCMLQALPSDEDEALTDTLWLYFGTQAMHEIGSRPWQSWSKAMVPLALAAQNTKGPMAGSFDPKSVAWGFSTGRVGATALSAAALQTAAY